MSRSRLLAAAAVTASLLALTACGSDSEPGTAADPATSAAPTTAAPTSATPDEVPTTTPTPTAPTTSAPSGRLISYADGDDTGVTIATAADTSKLQGAPADFKAFIAAELATTTTDEGCTEKPQISVDVIDTGGWARGGHFIPQCGGYATLWAKDGGTWKDVWGGQSLVECSTLDRYEIPARVAGDQCLRDDKTVAYSR